jgi:hypothetical protein
MRVFGPGRSARAVLGAVAIVLAIGWFDHVVLEEARRLGAATFRMTESYLPLEASGYLFVAGGILAIAGLGRWARGLIIGIVYGAMGLLLVFLGPLSWGLGAGRNEEPAILPGWMGRPLLELAALTDGPIGAVGLLGAGLLLTGLIVLVGARPATDRDMSASARAEPVDRPA